MEATRVRWGPLLEWAVAAACILAALGVGTVVVRELRTVPSVTPSVIAEEAPIPEPPAVIPPQSVSLPMLLLTDGTRLHVGERVSSVKARVNPAWQVGSESLERGPKGDRVTRTYTDGTTEFLLVFEPGDSGAEARLAAIYVK
jgi:hypothetical protein